MEISLYSRSEGQGHCSQSSFVTEKQSQIYQSKFFHHTGEWHLKINNRTLSWSLTHLWHMSGHQVPIYRCKSRGMTEHFLFSWKTNCSNWRHPYCKELKYRASNNLSGKSPMEASGSCTRMQVCVCPDAICCCGTWPKKKEEAEEFGLKHNQRE